MKLTESTAVIRPRRGWEAIDLGIRMAQRDFSALSRRWVISTLPWFVLTISLGHYLGDISYGILLFWWLKPAFDRVLLDFYGQRLFSDQVESPSPFDLWLRIPFSNGAWRQLTYLRLSLVRTFSMPVYQLEGASDDRGARIRTLVSRDYGASAWLTMVFWGLSYTLILVLISQLSAWLTPSPLVASDTDFFDYLLELDAMIVGPLFWLHLGLLYVITGIFEIFFVGAGFAMYLNRRTHLEAWDIELSFRRLAQRLGRGAVSALLISVMLVFTTVTPAPAAAQTVNDAAISTDESGGPTTPTDLELPTTENARGIAEEIFAGEEFGKRIQDRVWRPKDFDLEEDESISDDDLNVFDQLGPIGALFVSLLKYVLIAAVVIGLAMWIYNERKRLLRAAAAKPRSGKAAVVEDIAVEEEFVPDADVPEVVMQLWNQGQTRESLSYLYRSALSYLTTRHRLIIADHATEEDCLALVKANANLQVTSYFSDITRQWRLLAYGQRRPSDVVVNDLCQRWSNIADAPSVASTGAPSHA